MTAAITKLLQHGDPDAVGVFAQLAYVDNPQLSEVLAANYCSAMQVRCRVQATVGEQFPAVALSVALLVVVVAGGGGGVIW